MEAIYMKKKEKNSLKFLREFFSFLKRRIFKKTIFKSKFKQLFYKKQEQNYHLQLALQGQNEHYFYPEVLLLEQ